MAEPVKKAAEDRTDVSTPAKRVAKKVLVKKTNSTKMFRDSPALGSSRSAAPSGARKSRGLARDPGSRALPDSVSEETIERLIAEAESGIPSAKLRRRGRPAIGDEAASTYSVRLPDDLVSLVDGRSEIDGVTRGETIRRALIDYLTK